MKNIYFLFIFLFEIHIKKDIIDLRYFVNFITLIIFINHWQFLYVVDSDFVILDSISLIFKVISAIATIATIATIAAITATITPAITPVIATVAAISDNIIWPFLLQYMYL